MARQEDSASNPATTTRAYRRGTPAHAFESPCREGMCFSESTSTESTPESTTASGGRSDSPSSSGRRAPHQRSPGSAHHNHHTTAPGTAGLLCDSPSISASSLDLCTMSRPAQAATRQHMQAAGRCRSGCGAGSGINSHGLQLLAAQQQQQQQPGFAALPSLHSMLGASAGAASKAADGDPSAQPAAMHRFPTGRSVGQQVLQLIMPPAAAAAAAASTGATCSAQQQPPRGDSSSAPRSSQSDAQVFLQACGSPGAVEALAVLAHNSLLPQPPVMEAAGAAASDPAAPVPAGSPLAATLSYMFVLAGRGGVLDQLSDTSVRTLLWMTEAFSSQYRNSVNTVVQDYLYYATGLPEDDPLVLDTLAEEVPAMVTLQRHILVASDFRLLVTEQQLAHACSTLAAAGNVSSGSSSSSTLEAIEQRVAGQVQTFQAWHEAARAALVRTEDEPAHKKQRLAADSAADTAAVAAAAGEAGVGAGATQQQRSSTQQQRQRQRQRQRQALHDVTNTTVPMPQQPQQQQQQQQQNKRKHVQASQRSSSGAENASNGPSGAAAVQAGSRRAKDQLLQLASRERAVGSFSKPWQLQRKRGTQVAAAAAAAQAANRATEASAAAAAALLLPGAQPQAQQEPQQQQAAAGLLSGLGVGGRRLARKVFGMAGYLGCRPQ